MPFEKGKQKTGGKQKGYTSEPTKKAAQLFVSILEGEVDFIKDAFQEVRMKDKAKYLELYAKYAQYFIPKKAEFDNKHTIEQGAIIDWSNEGDNKAV